MAKVHVAHNMQLEDHYCKNNLEDVLWNGKEYEYMHFNFTLTFELCLCWTCNPTATETVRMLTTRVWQVEGREPFLPGSVAEADVFSGFIYPRVAQKYFNAQPVFSGGLILS